MPERIIDIVDGVTTTHEYDAATDTSIVRRHQDVEAILEANKALQNADDKGWVSRSREMRRVASIPNVIIEKWRIEKGIDVFNPNHKEAVKRLLNDPEWLYLRTGPGRI